MAVRLLYLIFRQLVGWLGLLGPEVAMLRRQVERPRAMTAALVASQVRAVLRGHEAAVWAVAWSPDGRQLATASNDRTIRVWDTQAGSELAILRVSTAREK